MQLLNVCKDMLFSYWNFSFLFVVCILTTACRADELTGLQNSAFPQGPFVLPMSKDGCAEEASQGWTTGFINITTAFPFDKLESYHRSCSAVAEDLLGRQNSDIDEIYILGPFDKYTLQMNFCYKARDHTYNNHANWPPGIYGIYGTQEGCPSGFTELLVTLCLPKVLHYNIDGSLPGLTIEEHDDFAEMVITYCQRRTEFNDTAEHQFLLNSSHPFLLIKEPEMTSEPCFLLTGYDVSEESFPIPLPAVLSNGNTSFYLTYCRYVPYEYGKEKQSWDVFPGTLLPFLDISVLVHRCGDTVIGTYIEHCGEVEVWVMIDAGSTVQVSGVMWSDENKDTNKTKDLGNVTYIFIGNKRWSFKQHGALLCGHSRPKTNINLTGVAEVHMCDRPQLGRYVTVVFRVGSWENSNVFSDSMMYILSDDVEFAARSQFPMKKINFCKMVYFNVKCEVMARINNTGFRNTTAYAMKLDQNWNAIFTGLRKIDNLFAYVTSNGFQYKNSLFAWNITLSYTYVRLQFVYIDLRIPKEAVSSVFLNNRRCKDSIFISSTEIKNPFVDLQDSQNYIHLDSRYNQRQPIFLPAKYRGEYVFLTFFVCSAYDIEADGAGFRVYILDNLYPVCTERCTDTKMELITDNFLGQFVERNRQFYWAITTTIEDVKGILKIEDFDISCYSASEFYINDERYCNQNISSEEQYFALRYVQYPSISIIVRYDRIIQIPEENNVFPEGFQLSYKLNEIELLRNFETYQVGIRGGWVSMELCSTRFGKCYHIEHAHTKSWIDIAKMCKGDNFLLVNVKTPEELEALRSMLELFYKNFIKENIIMNMDVFIGLSRYVDFTGRLKEQWTDGTVLTHEAWDVNQPSDIGIKECTMMNLVKPDGTFSWFTTPCNQIIERESIYVCEQDTKGQTQSEKAADFTDNWLSKNITKRKDHAMLFQCSSGEWMSHMVRCNGLRECLDASDELDCSYSISSCDENMFTCTSGQCIHLSQMCDHKIDCLDSSDEYCSFPECNWENEFTCNSGQCIPKSQRCDSYTDCVDGSDEILCASCNQEKAFQCSDTSCISLRLVCDKTNDCPDASDERSCDVKYETCDDFWRHGFTMAREYTIDGNLHIKCSLDTVENLLRMTLLNSDWKVDGDRKFRVIIPISLSAATNKGYTCQQLFYKESNRERTFYDSLEDRHNKFKLAGYNQFQKEGVVHVTHLVFEPESMSVAFHYYAQCVANGPYRVGEPYTLKSNDMIRGITFTLNNIFTTFEDRIVIGEIDCFKEFHEQNQLLSCGRGVGAVSYQKQCMYSIDRNGVLDGCRSWNHLQNCRTFVCPWDHFKCTDSYCVPFMYVCNGFIDCPNGEDEHVCDCSNKRQNTMGIIVFGSGYIPTARSNKLYEKAFRLGGSIYTEQRKIYVLKVNECEGPCLISIDSTQILSRSERVTKVFQNYKIVDGDNFLQIVFGEKKNESVGLVVISDDVDLNDAEQYLTANLRNITENVSLQRIVIDSHAKVEALSGQPSNGYEKEIIIQNVDVLGTLGSALFPDLCKDRTLTCRGHFRCRLSMVCIPVDQVCDGKIHCPYEDDEHYCNFECPEECRCGALIMNCSKADINHTIEISQETRVIDASYTNRIAVDILKNQIYTLTVLTVLNVSNCELEEIDHSSFQNLQNLITLDISFNRLQQLTRDSFISLPHLQYLYLTGNRLLETIEAGAFNRLLVKSLSIRHTNIKTLGKNTFAGLKLTKLDLSGNKLENIEDLAFNLLKVELINIEDNKITEFSNRMFEGVENLVYLKTSSFKLCCVKPPYLSEESCYPPKDEFSSCEHLMRNITLKTLMWTIGSLALIGNVLSILYRLIYDRPRLKLGYGVFVTNLGISDLLMGIYLLIIAIADKIFEGSYIEFDERWRQSGWCQFAGMLSTLSSEASVLFMVFITLDRLLIIKYPFGDFRFKMRTAVIGSIGCWLTAFTLAILPILLRGYFDNFYGKSAVCLALPLTRDRPPGWLYSILIFIGFNMVTFLLIGFGQWLIYKEIKRTTNVFKQQRKNAARANDLKITRNLLLLVSTDFMCWFPIGFMGFLSLTGHDIPGVVYSWAAVLILPINSALNPFLYTFMSIVSKKNFTPRLTEQSTTENKQVSGESILGVTNFICMNAKWSVKKSFTLAEILQEHNLSLKDLGFIVYNVIKYLASLEECGLTLQTISERQILLQLDENKHVRRKIFFIGKPVLCKKKTDQAESISKFGIFLDKVISSNSRD